MKTYKNYDFHKKIKLLQIMQLATFSPQTSFITLFFDKTTHTF